MLPQPVFRPAEGAVLDLESLLAVSSSPERLLGAGLAQAWPGAPGLILSGLELQAEAGGGQPGNVRPEARSTSLTVSAGSALVTTREGRLLHVELREPLRIDWPTPAGPEERQGALVLDVRESAVKLGGADVTGLSAARSNVEADLRVVRLDQASRPYLLPIAWPAGRGGDWATDLRRIWQPDHPAMVTLIRRLEQLALTLWSINPQGGPWDRGVFGKDWLRYQMVASGALEGTRVALSARATSTLDRVRLLGALLRRLQATVPRAAEELVQILGGANAVGPYQELTGRGAGEAA